MDKCRLVIIHWSIIINIIFGIYYVSSASIHSSNYNSPETIKTTETAITTNEKILISSPSSSTSSSSSSLADILGITTESFCSQQIERYVQSEGKESSLIFELKPNLITYGTCKRILIAPESHGFFIRLVRPPKVKKSSNQSNSGLKNKHHGISQKLTNSTYSCPLSIFSANDPLTPWRIDPCQIELNNDVDEPVRLLQGRLRIVWDHGGNSPSSHLMITVLGKGIPCQQSNKQPCLRFGTETLLCISKDLICDGIRHCPKGSNYDSDENYEMCAKYKKNIYADYDSDAWEHLRIEIFRNLFNVDKSIMSTTTAKNIAQTTMIKIDSISNNNNNNNNNNLNKNNLKKSNSHDTEMHKNVTRSTIAGDLSKYGPWGYLMLGMLLSGGALLICGLWECCCRQNKSDDTTITGSTLPGSGTNADIISSNETIQDISPPNYDELDPPPAYSVLFPNQKLSSCSSSLVTTQISISESFNNNQHTTGNSNNNNNNNSNNSHNNIINNNNSNNNDNNLES